MGEVCPARPVWKSREIDSRPPAGRFDSKPRQGSKPSRASAGGLPHAIDAFRSGEAGFPSPFAGFLPRSGAPAAVRHHRGLRRTRCASSCDSIIGVKSAVTDSAASPSIRCEGGLPAGTSCLLRCVHPTAAGSTGAIRKKPNKNNILQQNFNHDPVLFVQHPLEKGCSRAARSGSLVACAGVLGNCDQATEGGIPRSSRFRWFA